MDVRGGCPCEPEESCGQDYGADDHGRETGLGDEGFAGLQEELVEACFGVDGDVDTAQDYADEDPEEGEGGDG